MIDIYKQEVKIDCTECSRSIKVTLKQVTEEALIKCNCGQEIQLQDRNGKSKKALKDLEKSFKKFENALNKLGN